jgi:hypothetical protein
MNRPSLVAVYSFQLYTISVEYPPIAAFKATREVIRDVYKGEPLEGTKELVPAEELDSAGRFRRIPTGWGALN